MTQDTPNVEKLAETVEKLTETVEQQAERIEELETELSEYKDHNELDKAKIRKSVTEVSDEIEEATDPNSPGELDPDAPPLFNLIRTPAEQLTPTRRRAKDVWRNLTEYCTTIPAGETITGPELRRVLSASEPEDGARIKSEHARRVMEELQAQTRGAVKVSKDGDGRLQMIVPKDWNEQAREAYYDHPDHARQDEPAASHSVVRGN